MAEPRVMPPRVVIVGAGPAGIRAAETLVAAGLTPVVIDEGRRDGGQIYRRQPDNFRRSYTDLYGTEADRAKAVHAGFDAVRGHVDYRPETLVWNIADGQVWTANGKAQDAIPYDALILCTGATDRLMPMAGWDLPGTYSLGGAQVALKAQACAIGSQVVFLGTGPLLYLVAAQYIKAGAKAAAVLDTSGFAARLTALPDLLSMPSILWSGIALTRAIKAAGVPLLTGVTPLAIQGDSQAGVTGVTVRTADGAERHFAADAVAMGYHLRPETQLADLARCTFAFDDLTRQYLPVRDQDGRAQAPEPLYLAGDGARVLGARSAEASGRLAALAALTDLGLPVDRGQVIMLRREVSRYARFARGLARAFPWPQQQAANLADDTILCRCECVTVGDLRRTMDVTGAAETNRAKAFSRVGMGRCQGRYCGHAAAEVIAAQGDFSVADAGRLRGQAPVKPLPIAIGEAE